MANYSNLLATIAANIYTNGNNEVTAAMVKTAVDQMVASLGAGYQFMGVATPATNPGNSDVKQFYIASTPGTYTNFLDSGSDPLEVYNGEVALLKYSTAWSKAVTGAATAAELQTIARQNFLLAGFTPTPIDIDNFNTKFVWDICYFRVDGKYITVPAGEIAFSSYSGINTALGFILVIDSNTDGHFEISGNSGGQTPHVMENYVVAYFYRSGDSWADGPVVSVRSLLPFTIDGRYQLPTRTEVLGLFTSGNSERLIMGKFGNVGANSAGLPTGVNTKRAGMLTTLALPYKGVTLHFTAPFGYVAGIRHGNNAQDLNNNIYWFSNGDSYTFPAESNYYRIIYAIQLTPGVSVYEEINAADVEAMVASGVLAITYNPLDSGAIGRNVPSGTRAAAVCFLDGDRFETGIDKYPIFLHTTDIHGDVYRLRDAIHLAKANNADALLVTGDVNAYNVLNGYDALESAMLDSDVPVAYCRGNHETYGNGDTMFDVFTTYYSKLATKWGYLKSTGTETDKTYYFKDIDAKKIRIIALDPYENNLTSNNAGAFSQGQINWFIATLKSTPADYGIVCILHSPEAYPSNQVSIEPLAGKTDFFLEGTPDYWSTPGGISGTPLKDIVDAFISRGTISSSFTQTATGGVSETITISGDFTSGISTGVEFIAWVCGHQHLDLVGVYKNTTNKQVVLNMTCGVCYYGNSSYAYLCNVSDLPRNSIGVAQDAINVYAIDRVNKEIRIARIGADMTEDFRKREIMTIPYAD